MRVCSHGCEGVCTCVRTCACFKVNLLFLEYFPETQKTFEMWFKNKKRKKKRFFDNVGQLSRSGHREVEAADARLASPLVIAILGNSILCGTEWLMLVLLC